MTYALLACVLSMATGAGVTWLALSARLDELDEAAHHWFGQTIEQSRRLHHALAACEEAEAALHAATRRLDATLERLDRYDHPPRDVLGHYASRHH